MSQRNGPCRGRDYDVDDDVGGAAKEEGEGSIGQFPSLFLGLVDKPVEARRRSNRSFTQSGPSGQAMGCTL